MTNKAYMKFRCTLQSVRRQCTYWRTVHKDGSVEADQKNSNTRRQKMRRQTRESEERRRDCDRLRNLPAVRSSISLFVRKCLQASSMK